MIIAHNKEIDNDEDIPDDEKENHKLPVLRFRDLRHTHATLLLRAKTDTKIVSKKLRHSRASFTADVYQHVTQDIQKETAYVMDDIFVSNIKKIK